jgi:putative endonuclease
MAFSLRRKFGNWGESIACQEYVKLGYILVARNTFNRRGKQLGEIDLIMRTEKHLAFVEVKTRRTNKFGTGAEAVTATKLRKLSRVAKWFLKQYPQYNRLIPRIDVCVVEVDKTGINVIIVPSADILHS